MKEKLAKLIDVKSIVTLLFTVAYLVMAFIMPIPQEIQTIYLMIIAFYFGTQSNKIINTQI